METGFEALQGVPDLLRHLRGHRDLAGDREVVGAERHIDAALAVWSRLFDHDAVAVGLTPALHEVLEVLVLGPAAPEGRPLRGMRHPLRRGWWRRRDPLSRISGWRRRPRGFLLHASR